MGSTCSFCFGNLSLYDKAMNDIYDLKQRVAHLEQYNHLLIDISHNKSSSMYENILFKQYINDQINDIKKRVTTLEDPIIVNTKEYTYIDNT